MYLIFKKTTYALVFWAICAFAPHAHAADPIVGNWKTKSGETALISACGNSFCTKLVTGTYSGRTIGKMKKRGNTYSGTITDPRDDKTYSGTATISRSTITLQGCILKVFCKTQKWKKL